MSSSFFGGRRSWDDDLERRISMLSRELSALSKQARKQSAHIYGDTRDGAVDLYDDLAERIQDMMPEVRKQAQIAERAARDHPVLVLAGLAVVGLAAAALMRR